MLSVIIPCFNEQESIQILYSKLKDVMMTGQWKNYELIFVNDGSTDNTAREIKELAQMDSTVKYINFSRNFGKESAMLAGISLSSGNAIVIIDADLQHPPFLIPQMYDYYLQGYDQVIARRTRQGDNKVNSLFANVYYKIVNKLTDVEMLDGAGDFRLLSRRAVNALLSLQEYNRFSKGLFSWIGFKQHIIEYENQQREVGQTKWSFKSLLNYGIQGIMSFNDKPLRVCFNIGLMCIGVSFVYILWTFIMILINGIAVGGYFTTISAILILGGVQLLSIGVLGEYIGKIYYEVKKRPHYLIDETNIKTKKNNNELGEIWKEIK